MIINLINGSFETHEIIDILAEFMKAKIRFHESKISHTTDEADIEMREKRIRELQDHFLKARNYLIEKKGRQHIQCQIDLG